MYILTLTTIDDFAEVCNDNKVDIRLDIEHEKEDDCCITAFDFEKRVIYEYNLAALLNTISMDLIKETGLKEWKKRKKLTYEKLKEILYIKHKLYFKPGKWRAAVPTVICGELPVGSSFINAD